MSLTEFSCLYCGKKTEEINIFFAHVNSHSNLNEKTKREYISDIRRSINIEKSSFKKVKRQKVSRRKKIKSVTAKKKYKIQLNDENFFRFKREYLKWCYYDGIDFLFIKKVKNCNSVSELRNLLYQKMGSNLQNTSQKNWVPIIYTPMGGQPKFKRR